MNKKNVYLTSKFKLKYMEDFNLNVLNCKNDIWKIDDFLKDCLIKINENRNIQTLYSKRFNYKKEEVSIDYNSYIKFCFTKKVEIKILRQLVSNLICIFKLNDNVKVYYTYDFPKENYNFSFTKDCVIDLDCINNKDYFKINHITLEIKSENLKEHEKFWNYLTEQLSSLG